MNSPLVIALLLGATGAPVTITLDGADGVRPGMSPAAVSARWGLPVRPSYEVRPDCGEVEVRRAPIDANVVFTPRGRLGAVFFRRGAVTGRGIRIGSTAAEVRRAYGPLRWERNRFVPGGRATFVRRGQAPHWELRIDVGANGRVTQIAFGAHAAVRLLEGCA